MGYPTGLCEVSDVMAKRASLEWLTASVVHDLRNPLSAIHAGSEILPTCNSTPHQVQRLAGNIHSAALRMRTLLTELLAAVRGSFAPAELCSLSEMILAGADAALSSRASRNVELHMNVPASIETRVMRAQMEAVFFNLVAKACDAMPDGGQINIHVRQARSSIQVVVEDNGPGIPSAIREHLFDPFVTAGKPDGMGQGAGPGVGPSGDSVPSGRYSSRRYGGCKVCDPAIGSPLTTLRNS
jgi:signal transduction histidine kinase